MKGSRIRKGAKINKAIIAESVDIGSFAEIGIGEEVPNVTDPNIYSFGLATIGEGSKIPAKVKVGKNTAISGKTVYEDYEDGILESGQTLIKAGERA